MSTRIALVVPTLMGGGAERVNIWLANEFLKRGYEVDFVLAEETGELLDLVPESARVIGLSARRLRHVLFPLVRYLKRERPDAVLANMWPLTVVCLLAHRMARQGSRIVVSDHNTLSRAYAAWGWPHKAMLRATMALAYRLADARVAVSSGVAADLASLSCIDGSRFTVVHNPIPLPAQHGDEATAEAAWGGFAGKRILTVGSFTPQKNQLLLVSSFARLAKTVDARLMLLGDGPMRDEIKAAVANAGLTGKVVMPGFFIDPEPFYRSADLFVLSSDHEGLPTVLIEAMHCGLPVVSTDCPSGPAEILDGGRFGAIVPCGDAGALSAAMAVALNSAHDVRALMARAADFSPCIAAGKYLDLLLPGESDRSKSPAEGDEAA